MREDFYGIRSLRVQNKRGPYLSVQSSENFFARLLFIQQRGKRMCKCRKRKCRKRKYQRKQPLLRKRYRYRSKNPARSSDHKMRKIQQQQLRTKMLTFSFFCAFKTCKTINCLLKRCKGTAIF